MISTYCKNSLNPAANFWILSHSVNNYNGGQNSLVHCCNAANYLCFIAEFRNLNMGCSSTPHPPPFPPNTSFLFGGCAKGPKFTTKLTLSIIFVTVIPKKMFSFVSLHHFCRKTNIFPIFSVNVKKISNFPPV